MSSPLWLGPTLSRWLLLSRCPILSRPRTTASVVSDLVRVVAEIRKISERVLPLPYDAHEAERTIQALLDAISAIEHATEVLTQPGERTWFQSKRAREGEPSS